MKKIVLSLIPVVGLCAILASCGKCPESKMVYASDIAFTALITKPGGDSADFMQTKMLFSTAPPSSGDEKGDVNYPKSVLASCPCPPDTTKSETKVVVSGTGVNAPTLSAARGCPCPTLAQLAINDAKKQVSSLTIDGIEYEPTPAGDGTVYNFPKGKELPKGNHTLKMVGNFTGNEATYELQFITN